jgi:hypothetical protein
MKQKHPRRLALIISTICIGTPLHAADITWDTAATEGIQGGAGTWGAFTTNWTSDDGVTRVAWNNATFAADTALFTTGTGRVTVDGTINLKGITNTSSDTSSIGGRTISYVMEGTGSLNFGSQPGVIKTSASGLTNLQINNNLIGSGGLNIDGANAPHDWQWLHRTCRHQHRAHRRHHGGKRASGCERSWQPGHQRRAAQWQRRTLRPDQHCRPCRHGHRWPGLSDADGSGFRKWHRQRPPRLGGRTLTLSAALTGSGDASKSDTGLLVISNATGYSGVITQVAGSTSVSGDFGGSISAATGALDQTSSNSFPTVLPKRYSVPHTAATVDHHSNH